MGLGICGRCGVRTPAGATSCRECGAPLEPGAGPPLPARGGSGGASEASAFSSIPSEFDTGRLTGRVTCSCGRALSLVGVNDLVVCPECGAAWVLQHDGTVALQSSQGERAGPPAAAAGQGGLRRALPLVILVLLAGLAGAFYCLRGVAWGVTGVDELARLAPSKARVFLAIALTPRADDAQRTREFLDLVQKSPAGAQALKSFEDGCGSSVDEVLAWVSPAGFLALLPAPSGQEPSLLCALGTRDEAATRRAVERLAQCQGGPKLSPTTLGEASGWQEQGDGRLLFFVARGYLVVGTSRSEVGALLERLQGAEGGLSSNEAFRSARARVGKSPESLVWVDLKGLLGDAGPRVATGSDAGDQALRDLQTLCVGAVRKSGTWTSTTFLGIAAPPKSALSQALLRKPDAGSLDPATLVPADCGLYTSVDLAWSWGLAREVLTAALGPEAFAGLSGDLGQDPGALAGLAAGPLGVATDVLDVVQQGAASGNVQPTFLFVMGTRDPAGLEVALEGIAARALQAVGNRNLEQCASNLNEIGEACQRYRADQGRYPSYPSELVPDYLRAMPTCPSTGQEAYSSTFSAGSDPDCFEVACSGQHTSVGVGAGFPRYDSEQGLADGRSSGFASGLPASAMAEEMSHNGTRIQGLAGNELSLRWAVTEQPEAAALVGVGPRALEMVQQALDARQSAQALADREEYREGVGKLGGGLAGTSYLEVDRALAAAAALFKSARPDDQGLLSGGQGAVIRKMLFGCWVGQLWVEDGGLRVQARGLGNPLLGYAAGAVLVPNFLRARAQGQYVACTSTLKNIATALEMYSTDHQGRYPSDLSQLVPDYLRVVPTCPASGVASYRIELGPPSGPDSYVVVCGGAHHGAVGVGQDFPRYTSAQGLLER